MTRTRTSYGLVSRKFPDTLEVWILNVDLQSETRPDRPWKWCSKTHSTFMSSLKEQYIFEKPQPLHFILPLTPWHRPLGEGKVTLLYLPRAVLERHYAGEEEEAAFFSWAWLCERSWPVRPVFFLCRYYIFTGWQSTCLYMDYDKPLQGSLWMNQYNQMSFQGVLAVSHTKNSGTWVEPESTWVKYYFLGVLGIYIGHIWGTTTILDKRHMMDAIDLDAQLFARLPTTTKCSALSEKGVL